MDQHQKIVVTGFLQKDGKVLLIKRSQSETFFGEHFEMPGGKVDLGEDPKMALIREFKEETNLDIMVKKPYYTFSYMSYDDTRHTVEIAYVVELKKDKAVVLSDSHSEAVRIERNKLGTLKISKEMKEAIQEGFSSIKKNPPQQS